MTCVVLRGGRVLDPAAGRDELADVFIEAGRVTRVVPHGASEPPPSGHVYDVEGCWVCPGFVDLHTHLREPGHEYKETIATGLEAAAAGGFTTVCAMPNTRPVNDQRAVTEMMTARARAAGGSRLRPIGAITKGLQGRELSEMADLREAGAFAVSDDGRCVTDSAVMRRAMEYARTFDLLVIQHCEDHALTAGAQMHEGAISTRLGLRGWPRVAEDLIVARDLRLAELTGARYHVAHISSFGAVELLREAKSRGLPVTAEVTPHHLMLTDEALLGYPTYCKVNPPLREAKDREALREALRDGTIDCIATDHAPHGPADKQCEFGAAAVGINGLETALSVAVGMVEQEVLTPMRMVEVLSTVPGRLLGEASEAGSLRPGTPADVTVVNPSRRWTVRADALRSRSHNTPLLNHELLGTVQMTFVSGQLVYRQES